MTENDLMFYAAVGMAIAFLVVGLVRLMTYRTARSWRKHEAETIGKWRAEGVNFVRGPVGCQFGGLESTGITRVIRGIGLVVLTDNDLRITRAAPLESWCIGFKQIKGITFQAAFLGKKSNKAPFIVIRFNKNGQTDKLAFQVREFKVWADDIAAAARVSLKDKR